MIPTNFKPMKGEAAQIEDIQLPCYAGPKIDGVRCLVFGGVAYTASMEPHGNLFVQKWAKENAEALEGLDGEIAVGAINDPLVFKHTAGALNRKEGEPDFTFWVFDTAGMAGPYEERCEHLFWSEDRAIPRVEYVKSFYLGDRGELAKVVKLHVSQGYEGTMVRSPEGPYKFGRSTIKEGYLLKLKSFIDNEAEIIGVVEEMRNMNKAEKDAMGRTKRSSAKAGKVGKGTLGKFLCRGLNGQFKGVEFSVGTGTLTKEGKASLWREYKLSSCFEPPASCVVGACITYTHMEHNAGYSKPRHAGFMRFRPRNDVTTDY